MSRIFGKPEPVKIESVGRRDDGKISHVVIKMSDGSLQKLWNIDHAVAYPGRHEKK